MTTIQDLIATDAEATRRAERLKRLKVFGETCREISTRIPAMNEHIVGRVEDIEQWQEILLETSIKAWHEQAWNESDDKGLTQFLAMMVVLWIKKNVGDRDEAIQAAAAMVKYSDLYYRIVRKAFMVLIAQPSNVDVAVYDSSLAFDAEDLAKLHELEVARTVTVQLVLGMVEVWRAMGLDKWPEVAPQAAPPEPVAPAEPAAAASTLSDDPRDNI